MSTGISRFDIARIAENFSIFFNFNIRQFLPLDILLQSARTHVGRLTNGIITSHHQDQDTQLRKKTNYKTTQTGKFDINKGENKSIQ